MDFTGFGLHLLCTLYLTVEGFKKALWKGDFGEYDFQKSIFSPCGMNDYEHDLGRSKTNLDVFYPVLNLFFALNHRNHPNSKNYITYRFPSTRILRALKLSALRILVY